MPAPIPVVTEATAKRAFATALEWPGWCRGGRDEAGALAALVAYGPRYARVAERAEVAFAAPEGVNAFAVVERLPGGSGTDWGAPGIQAASEDSPLDAANRTHLESLLAACWAEFEAIAHGAQGRELRKGPRGGGRELDTIVNHAVECHVAYIKQLGAPAPNLGPVGEAGLASAVHALDLATAAALDASGRGELPTHGPRGGRRWRPRFFLRYAAWHVLDHAWEIEDRLA